MFQVQWSLASSTTPGDKSFRKRTYQATFNGARSAHREFDLVAKEVKHTKTLPTPAPKPTPTLPAPTRTAKWTPIKQLVKKADVLEVSETEILRLADLHDEISASGAEGSDMEFDKGRMDGHVAPLSQHAARKGLSIMPGNDVSKAALGQKSLKTTPLPALSTPVISSLDNEFDAFNEALQVKLDEAIRKPKVKRHKTVKMGGRWPFPVVAPPGSTSDDTLSLAPGSPADHVALDEALIGCIDQLCDVDTDDDEALLADLLKTPPKTPPRL